MYDSIIKLVSQSKTVDEYGDINVVNTERTVFCEVKSIGQKEFYQAQALGLKPEIKFVLPDYLEYKMETVVKFADYGDIEREYSVLRTYRNNNLLEIVCVRGIDQ